MSHDIIFAQQSVAEFTDLLASSASTPGGGAAGGLVAAQGVALVGMVCNLTTGKEKFAEYQELMDEVLVKCESLQKECLDLMDSDAVAFHEMMACYKMPKGTEEEKALHQVAKESALKACTLPPLELMEVSMEGLALVKAVMGRSNGNAVSDLGAAATMFLSALETSWLNVVINLKDIQDSVFEKEKRSLGEEMLDSGRILATELYHTVLEWLE